MSDTPQTPAVGQDGADKQQEAAPFGLSVMMNAEYEQAVTAALADMKEQNVVGRIWKKDHTVWDENDPTELSNRLGWLDCPDNMQSAVERIYETAFDVTKEGFTHVLLLGMGGSSLAPELFMKTFGGEGLTLYAIDSTDPDFVQSYYHQLDLTKTLFIVATKSGGTVETLSFFKYFFNKTALQVGFDKAGRHFIGITDPGSKLEAIANFYKFRDLFLNDPNIGGRFSALSYFGLVPASFVGVDLNRLLKRAAAMATNNHRLDLATNSGLYLGALLGELAKLGRDKMTLVPSAGLESFGDWVEQLIAESTGKNGQGILPVVGETLGAPDLYGDDRVFVHLQLEGDDTHTAQLETLAEAGHPVVVLALNDLYDVGAQFFLWEMATAVSGQRLNIHPFNQPDVEAAKTGAKSALIDYGKSGTLDRGESVAISADALHTFLAQSAPNDYISIHAYIQPTDAAGILLADIQTQLRERYKLPVTIGYGPRFLHSTGQLHKGDRGNGLFIQLLSDAKNDVDIPETAGENQSTMTFDVLKHAQAVGDATALTNVDRRLIRFNLGNNVVGGLKALL